jgi:predicted glycosyltransferase
MGLGHMRRNLTIARALAESNPQSSVLMLAGARNVTAFTMPPGVDYITLPALHKGGTGSYRSRSLKLSLAELTALRSNTIRASLEAFQPDILIVDNVPRGVNGELDQALADLNERGETHCVLGLRDVLDSPEAVAAEWEKRDNLETIRRFYSSVWVYGDPRVYDPVREYGLPADVTTKLSYTGYLRRGGDSAAETDATKWQCQAQTLMQRGKTLLCMVGGGQDGGELARLICRSQLPGDTHAVILTGPYMPTQIKHELLAMAAERPELQVLEFHPEPTLLMRQADRVISMGGYNSVSEILSLGKPSLIIPRVTPRREQMIRAERLRELGLIELAHPDHVTPEIITTWLQKENKPTRQASDLIDFNGLARLPHLVDEILNSSPPGTQPQLYSCETG